MSVAACRCCGLFTHPSRLRLLHTSTGATRAFSTSLIRQNEVKKLPTRDWGAFKPASPPARDSGAHGARGNDRGRDGLAGHAHRQPRGGNRGNHSRGEEERGRGHRAGHRESARAPKEPAQGFGLRDARTEERNTAASLPRRNWSARGPAAEADQLAKGEAVPAKSSAMVAEGDSEGAAGAEVTEEDYDNDDGSSRHGSRSRRRDAERVKLERDDEGVAFNRGQRRTTPTLQEQRYIDAMNEKQEREARRRQKERERQRSSQRVEQKVMIPSNVTVARLATIFGRKIGHVQSRMQRVGLRDEKQRADYILNAEEACDVALEFGFNPIVDDEAAFDLLPEPEIAGHTADLRPPVVTIMGHVDHGKTTLLDALRNTAVAAGEAGGITQHIGAFSVPLKLLQPGSKSDATITFLDTPGHAAFTAMRARGASVTDIVVLVVAADDGVMPQTKEVLELVKSEGDKVGLVVAINKVDKPEIDLKRVTNELLQEGVHLEDDGGDVQSVQVSGLARLGLDNLVETLSTLAELRDLRARTGGKAEGYVLESNVDRGIGRVATVLVTRGTLKVGSVVVAGNTSCKVRRMTDHTGKTIKSAGPGTPVVITGWKEIPSAGDELLEAPNGEREAAKVVANRIALADRVKLLADTEVINVKRQEDRAKLEAEQEAEKAVKQSGGNISEARLAASKRAAAEARENTYKELRIVIKGDVSGTVEAVEGALSGIGNKEAGVKVVHTGVGEVTDSDVAMAEASGAMVIGFNVPCAKSIRTSATQKHVDLHLESVIYRLIETVRKKTAALLPPTIESRTIGEGTVGEVFKIKLPKRQTQTVAGARCTNGTFSIHDKIRIMRGPKRDVVFEGPIKTLKHLKRDVDDIRKGMECGIAFEGFDDVLEGDEIVTFKTFEVAREL